MGLESSKDVVKLVFLCGLRSGEIVGEDTNLLHIGSEGKHVGMSSNINSNFYFCMSIDIPLISILMSIYMENLLKITHNLNASK